MAGDTRGRTLTLNAAVQETIVQAIRFGTPERRASMFAGIPHETMLSWRRRAREALRKPAGRRSPTERKYIEFALAVDHAIAEAVMSMQRVVYETATTSGTPQRDPNDGHVIFMPSIEDRRLALQASTWFLSHRETADYSTRLEHVGADGGPIETRAVTLDDIRSKLHDVDGSTAGDDEEGDIDG